MNGTSKLHQSIQGVIRGSAGLAGACLLALSVAPAAAQEASGPAKGVNPPRITILQTPATPPTYAKDVAPIIQQNCERCHRPNSVAPMALQSYEQAKRYAPLIRDRVSRRLMPPWPLDKTVGRQDFRNDISLSDEEIATVVNWVDAGAPEGNPADMPKPMVWNTDPNRWEYEDVLGRAPDLILNGPQYNVIANGRDQWPLQVTKIEDSADRPFTEERWIQAIGVRPGDFDSRYVFHHANVSLSMPGETPDPLEGEGSVKLIDSAVGSEGTIFPANTGRVIRPGSELRWNMHYHPYSEDTQAALQLAIWFYPKGQEPKYYTMGDVQLGAGQGSYTKGTFPAAKKERDQQVSGEVDILLAPNSVTTMRGYHVLDRPAMLNGLRGHMHLRGKYQIVEVIYPDGSWEVINKLNWDHGWHTLFLYSEGAEPLLPKGTAILLTSIFDNTTENPHNPDPDQWVSLGDRSIDEMSHVRLELTYFNDEDYANIVAEREQKKRATDSGKDK